MNNPRFFVSLAVGFLLFFLVLGNAILWHGGLGQLVAYANGESVYISPKTLNLGSCEAGNETVAVFRLTNLTSQELSVIGERSSCDCAFSEKLPVTVPPKKTVDIKVSVHLPKYDSAYDQTITFMIAEAGRLVMHPVRITATIPQPLPKLAVNPESPDQ